MPTADVTIIGGGIVGLATAHALLAARPELKLQLCEKEAELATHQTGRNSGVIHSGIYYKPGSLRATNCRAGKKALEQFCQENEIPFDLCGKVIVATNKDEESRLGPLLERGQANGVDCELISKDRLLELEPQVAGVAAIHVPETGIVDYKEVSKVLAKKITESGGEIHCGAQVTSITKRNGLHHLDTSQGEFTSRYLVGCAGLFSDRIAKLCGLKLKTKIIPFRGEYFDLHPTARHLCRNLIYPVPDPRFPFLGVHFTRMIDGSVECGPNAVFAFAREGYSKLNINPGDIWDAVTFRGFQKLGWKYLGVGLGEMHRSCSKSAFVKALQQLIPEIRSDQLRPAPAGVRAQALNPDGTLVDDFLIEEQDGAIHVLNAPSPAATSCLSIGETIRDRFLRQFDS